MNESGTLAGWKNWSTAIVTVILSVTPRFYHLNIPFDRDEGAYAYMADVIQSGWLPYINAFDHKPPLIYYFYYLSFNIFGHSVSSPRILAIFFIAAACLLLLVLVYRLTKNLPAATASSLILGFASAAPAYQGFSANTELFTLPFIVGGIVLLADEDPLFRNFFIAGLLFGIGFMIKQPVAVIAAFPLLFHCMRLPLYAPRLLKVTILFGIGAALPLGVVMLYFYLHGGFTAFWDACFAYNFGYMEQLSFSKSMAILSSKLKEILYLDPVIWLAGGAGLCLQLKMKLRRSSKAYLLVFLIGSAFATAMGRYYYAHYFIFMLPVLALFAGLAFSHIFSEKTVRFAWAGVVVLMSILCLSTARFITVPDDDLSKNTFHMNTFVQARSMGTFLQENAHPGATAFIVGSEAEILFYSGVKSSARVYYYYPLATPTRMIDKLRRETVVELLTRPPDFVVFVNAVHSLGFSNVNGDIMIGKLFDMFSDYRLIGVIAENSTAVVAGDDQSMRAIVAKGVDMLLFGRPAADAAGNLTLRDLLGQKAGN